MNFQQPRNRNTALLRKLSAAMNGHAAAATFTCGGSVPVVDGSAGLRQQRSAHLVELSKPVLCWG